MPDRTGWWRVTLDIFSDTGSPAEWNWPDYLDEDPAHFAVRDIKPAPTNDSATLYVIVQDGTGGISGFWSNDDGWGELSTATVFTEHERATLNLPIVGRWEALPELQEDEDG